MEMREKGPYNPFSLITQYFGSFAQVNSVFPSFPFPPPLSTCIHFENYSQFEQAELKTLVKKYNQKQQILIPAMP